MRWESKRPNEVRDYRHDWSAWLAGDTIATSAFTVAGVTKNSEANDTTTATVTLSGGTAGATATITNTITTAAGRTETEVFTLAITLASEPLSISDVKAQLNIPESDTTFDALLFAYIPAAREYVENRSDHILVQREFTEYRPSFGSYIELTRRPLFEVTEIGYIDSDGAEQTYDDSVAELNRMPARVHPAVDGSFPSIQSNTSVSVTYVAGFAPGEEPQGLLQAMRLLISTWFQNRESLQNGSLSEIPHGVDALCDQKRGAIL